MIEPESPPPVLWNQPRSTPFFKVEGLSKALLYPSRCISWESPPPLDFIEIPEFGVWGEGVYQGRRVLICFPILRLAENGAKMPLQRQQRFQAYPLKEWGYSCVKLAPLKPAPKKPGRPKQYTGENDRQKAWKQRTEFEKSDDRRAYKAEWARKKRAARKQEQNPEA